jgi:hypothetical protein
VSPRLGKSCEEVVRFESTQHRAHWARRGSSNKQDSVSWGLLVVGDWPTTDAWTCGRSITGPILSSGSHKLFTAEYLPFSRRMVTQGSTPPRASRGLLEAGCPSPTPKNRMSLGKASAGEDEPFCFRHESDSKGSWCSQGLPRSTHDTGSQNCTLPIIIAYSLAAR